MVFSGEFFALLTFLCTILTSASHHILVLHPVYAGSHIFAIRRIIEELLLKGHKIKVVRWRESSHFLPMNSPNVSETILAVNNSDGTIPFLSKEERGRYQISDRAGAAIASSVLVDFGLITKDKMQNVIDKFEFPDHLMWERGLAASSVFDGGMLTVAASCETLFTQTDLLRELRKTNFKLAIVDLTYNECSLALAHHLGLPVVAYWSLSFVSGEIQYTTAFNPPSTIPHLYIPFTDQMNFLQRFMNVWYCIGSHLVMQMHFSYTNHYIQKYLPDTPHPSTLLSNLSGMLINSHWAFDYPKQLPPSFFQIGGFHIRDLKALPEDLKNFMEDSDEGVILFSLGKNFDSHSLPSAILQAYYKVFSRLKQKVIVRSGTIPKNLPKNVKVMVNLPQAEILAHPKTILFVTHCGMHGVMEAIHFGVKMIAVPIFFDQGNVAVRLVDLGIALSLSKTASEADVFQAISTVIDDKRFETNMKRISTMYHSSFEKPLERALWLIDHVMTTKGADHLKLKSKNLTFMQYFCIDVLSVMAVILLIVFYLALKCMSVVGSKLCTRIRHQKEKLE